MSRSFISEFGNGKRHRDPPLRVKKLVCFGERTWVRLKEAVGGVLLEKRVRKRRKREKAATSNKGIKTYQDRGIRVVNFPVDGIGIRAWWEKENWALVTDPENLFGDLTREEEFRLRDLLKEY